MANVYLSYAREDRALAEALAELLPRAGLTVWWDTEIQAGSDFRDVIGEALAAADVVVVLWSERSLQSGWMLDQAEAARRGKKLLFVRLDATELPLGFGNLHAIDLSDWRGNDSDPRLREDLFAAIASFRPSRVGSAAAPARSLPPRLVARGAQTVGRVLNGIRALWSRKASDDPAPEPVLLAASAPHRCEPGATFTAALVAYVAAARASAQQKLADLGEPGDRRVQDVAASAWRPGAPVTVRLAGEGATITPEEIRFEWSGHENLAAFSVKAHATTAPAVLLGFDVLVADVTVAFIPMRVAIAAAQAGEAPNRVQGSSPRSAFASYASQDAEPVTQRLSTLSRWAPGLDIFQDCLDLKPGEAFKPQLAEQIAARDVFLLFWSRRAALSPWVRWEYTTAMDRKGLDAILPMPLEDPAIAPPPPELADRHLRDRYLLAGYGLAKVREEVHRL